MTWMCFESSRQARREKSTNLTGWFGCLPKDAAFPAIRLRFSESCLAVTIAYSLPVIGARLEPVVNQLNYPVDDATAEMDVLVQD